MKKEPLIVTENCGSCVIPGNTIGTNQLVITETLTIPNEKPDVEQVNQVIVQPEITDVKVVGIKDLRCEQLGLKVIVKGFLHEKIIYTACKPDQPVHSAEFSNPFYAFVKLDFDLSLKDHCGCFVTLPPNLANLIDVNLCIEDVAINVNTGRKLTKNLTILAIVNGDLDEIIDSIK